MQKHDAKSEALKTKRNEWARRRREEYLNIPTDIHNWVDALKYKPPPSIHYELVMIQDDQNKMQPGWWTGFAWEYCPKKVNGNILKWRLLKNDERVSKQIGIGHDQMEIGKKKNQRFKRSS